MSLKLATLPLLLLPLVSHNSFAEQLDGLVVTATRTVTPAKQSLSSNVVITRDDIERFHYQTLEEVLSALPGVVMANSGGVGKQTSLFLRGTESNHTNIMVNGVKMATNAFGSTQLEHIALDQIDRIELVKGPQSSLYGADAIGGTVQIFTQQAKQGFNPELSVSYGSHDTRHAQFGFSAANESSWVSLQAGHKETEGFNACDGRSGVLFIGCYADEPDDDAYRSTALSLRAGHQFTANTSVEIFSLSNEGEVEFDGSVFSGNETRFLEHTYGITLDTAITDIWSITTSLSEGRSEADTSYNGTDVNFADNKKNYFTFQNDIQLNPDYLFSIGYDYEQDRITSDSNYAVTSRDNKAVFGQLLGRVGANDFRIALRSDDNEQFGQHTTGNLAIGRQIQPNLRVFASFGTAFSAPTLADLYFPFSSNPDLEPEESTSVEIGLTGQHFAIDWTASLYQTRIDDLIILDDTFTPDNISEAVIRGLELTAKTRLYDVDFDAQLTLMDPENRASGNNKGNVLTRRAEQTFSLKAHKSFGAYSIASTFYASGRRFDDAANTRRLSSYNTLDVNLGYQINKTMSADLKIANLFDQSYETISGFNSDSTHALLTFRYRP